jgi:hypothetical protein
VSECYCDRCSGIVPCEVSGDHDYRGGTCRECGRFNGALLAWERIEKAQREGRHHGNHFHNTDVAAQRCPNPTHDEGPCADLGGCLTHDPSVAWMDAQVAGRL